MSFAAPLMFPLRTENIDIFMLVLPIIILVKQFVLSPFACANSYSYVYIGSSSLEVQYYTDKAVIYVIFFFKKKL